MDPKFLKPYEAGEVEPRIYTMWEERGIFSPDNAPEWAADSARNGNGARGKVCRRHVVILPQGTGGAENDILCDFRVLGGWNNSRVS